MDKYSQNEIVRRQFTRQALPYASAPEMKDEEALQLLLSSARAGPEDVVLDVACGPGIVACAFARLVRHVTGIDITPAMVQQAERLKAEKGLANVEFRVADALPLPAPDAAFTIVVARYALHHFLDPLAVLCEMSRACAQQGRVVVADQTSSPDPVKAVTFNRMEKMRDPSHVRALPLLELRELFLRAGLSVPRETFYEFRTDLDTLLARSFPEVGKEGIIREMFLDSLKGDSLGIRLWTQVEQIFLAYPIAVLVAEKQ